MDTVLLHEMRGAVVLKGNQLRLLSIVVVLCELLAYEAKIHHVCMEGYIHHVKMLFVENDWSVFMNAV